MLLGYLINNHGRFYQIKDEYDLEHLLYRVKEDCINLDIPFKEIEEIWIDLDKIPEERLKEIALAYQNKENWKYPPSPAIATSIDSLKEYVGAFIHYFGGVEVQLVKGIFKITSKGYYHYVGA